MGLENRDYLRDNNQFGGGGFSRPAQKSIVSKIIIATIGVFVLQLAFNGRMEEWFSMHGPSVFKGQIWRTLTYAFLHSQSSILHIVFNMLALHWFAREIEQKYGSREFLLFYLAAAVFAAIVQMATVFGMSQFPQFTGDFARTVMVGASGSTMAVMALFAINWPRREAFLMGVVRIEMRYLIPLMIISDLVMNHFGMRIAQSAHIGGLLFGFIYYTQGIRLERIFGGNLIGSVRQKAKVAKAKRRLKVYAPTDDEKRDTAPSSSLASSVIDEQLDHILAKINREGRESLTDHENAVLQKASELARQRRS